MTIEQLAGLVGITTTRLSRMERGLASIRLGRPAREFEKLLEGLSVSPLEFYGTIPAPWSDAVQAA